jgi:hypothetical protein
VAAFLRQTSERELEAIEHDWGWWGRPNQQPPKGDWRTWLLLAGRGFGKTRSGAECVRDQVIHHRRRRIALVAPTAADARDVMVEGESGMLAIGPPQQRPRYEPTKRRLTWPNGAIATTYSANEPERLRGPQHDAARCDEIASWRYPEAWDTKDEWPAGTRVMVRKRKSWREATIISRLDPDLWRAEYPGGGSGMFREADIRAYDPERDATPAKQSRRAKAAAPQKSSQSRYRIDPETIAAGRLPQRAPVVTSAANPHYQKHFDRLFGLAKAGDWDGVRNYEVKGSNSYSKMVARYRQDLLAVHAASEAAP